MAQTTSTPRRRRPETNEELVQRLMTFAPTGALVQVFILQALEQYAKAVVARPPQETGLVNPEAWLRTAQFIKDELHTHFQR